MKPIVVIHGYSSESPTADPTSIGNIYGDLPERLRSAYDVVEVDLSRYVSLKDSVSVADIFFVSEQSAKQTIPIQSLIENTVVSGEAPHCIVLRPPAAFRPSRQGLG